VRGVSFYLIDRDKRKRNSKIESESLVRGRRGKKGADVAASMFCPSRSEKKRDK